MLSERRPNVGWCPGERPGVTGGWSLGHGTFRNMARSGIIVSRVGESAAAEVSGRLESLKTRVEIRPEYVTIFLRSQLPAAIYPLRAGRGQAFS